MIDLIVSGESVDLACDRSTELTDLTPLTVSIVASAPVVSQLNSLCRAEPGRVISRGAPRGPATCGCAAPVTKETR